MSIFIDFIEIEILVKEFTQGRPASKWQVKDINLSRQNTELPEHGHMFIFIGPSGFFFYE